MFNLSMICAHDPKVNMTKEVYYVCLECFPRHDVEIVLGDFKARVRKESHFGTTIGRLRLYDEISPNGLRLIDLAWAPK